MAKKKTAKVKKMVAEKVKPSEVRQQIGARKLRELLATARSTHQDVREIAGSFGAEVKNAAEHDHLHKKAFGITRSLDRLEPEKLAEALDALDYYLDAGGLRARAAKVQRLPLGEGAAGTEDEQREMPLAPANASGGNVAPFPRPAGQSSE